jgi:hypothetical protein
MANSGQMRRQIVKPNEARDEMGGEMMIVMMMMMIQQSLHKRPHFPKHDHSSVQRTTHVTLHNSQKPDTTASALFSDEEDDGEMWMW